MSRSAPVLPRRVEDISAEFLTAALGSRFRGIEVASAHIADTRQGTSSSIRLLLDYARNDAGLPPNMFLKAGFFDHDFATANVSATEAHFYGELSGLLPVEVNRPTGFYGFVDENGSAVALMEDLTTRDVSFREATTPASVDEVATGLEQLAAMHARFWDGQNLGALSWLDEVAAIVGIMRYLVSPEHFGDYITRERARNIPAELTDQHRVAAALEMMFDTDARLPHTLLHGDPHLGNTFVEQDGRPGFLDWQFVARGPYIWDATYYLTGALEPADRQASERDLLTHYRSALIAGGAEAPSMDDIWLGHRRHMLHGFLSLMVPEESQPESFSRTMGERFAYAAAELDTLGALDSG